MKKYPFKLEIYMLLLGTLSQNATTRCPFYYLLDTVLDFSIIFSK